MFRMSLRLICAVAAVLLVVGLFMGGAQPVAVGLFAEPWDKVAHATVFGALAVLLAVALRGAHGWHGRAALGQGTSLALAATLAAMVAGVDELHQMGLPGRVAAWDDLFADAAGIVLALALWSWLWCRSLRKR